MKDEEVFYRKIKTAFKENRYRLTIHCTERCIERLIETDEIVDAISNGEVIEYYPEDKYGPSCLILGHTKSGRPLACAVLNKSGMGCHLL